MTFFRRLSLTFKMLALTAGVGLIVWAITDTFQTRSLEQIFSTRLAERFGQQAEAQRIRFDRYVKRHHQAVKLFIGTHSLANYARGSAWRRRAAPKIHRVPPPWLPQLSVLRNFILPRQILLLDPHGVVREIYQTQAEPPPAELLRPSKMLLSLSRNQGFLTTISDKLYLLAAGEVRGDDGRLNATLMLAAPLDEQFLLASQGSSLPESNVIALLTEDAPTILVSSNAVKVPPGTALDALKDRYLAIGQGFFDYGATDTIIVLASFVSTAEVTQITQQVLGESRRLRIVTAAIFITASVLLMFLITRRIQRFTARVVDFSRNMRLWQPEPAPVRGDQIVILEDNFRRLADAIRSETAALEHQALHDPLTELPNRKLLHNRIQQEILRAERRPAPFVLLISDLNHFKLINDTLGHHVGDLILQQAAERLFHIFRRSDSVARLGGDEFGVLLPATSLEQAMSLIPKVVAEFNKPFVVEDYTLSVGISIGIAEFPSHGNDVNILVQRADVAMYIAKRNNLGYSVYDPNKDTHSIGRLALMSDFRSAIEQGTLALFYQPKVDLRSGRVAGAEALLRWRHPERGYIDPEEFLPLAEQTGLFRPLTDMVLERAARQCMAWKQQGFDFSISVNLSTHSLHDTRLLGEVSRLIQELQLPPVCLTLEITESDIMTDPMGARETLEQLDRMGLTLSIDDFGTGYSSLSYLKQLPVQELKIDRSFVMEMAADENDATIVRAIIDLAHNLGLRVVGEGVKDETTWRLLKSLQCDVAQGFFISEPIPADLFTAWLNSSVWQVRSRAASGN